MSYAIAAPVRADDFLGTLLCQKEVRSMESKVTVSAKVPARIWEQAEAVLSGLGLSADDAVTAYFAMMAEKGTVPLDYGTGPIELDAPSAQLDAKGRIVAPDDWWDDDDE